MGQRFMMLDWNSIGIIAMAGDGDGDGDFMLFAPQTHPCHVPRTVTQHPKKIKKKIKRNKVAARVFDGKAERFFPSEFFELINL